MIILLALSIVLFFTKNRKSSLLIFVFFLTNGFQLVPTIFFSMGLGVKPYDYALLFVFGVLVIKTLLLDFSITKSKEPTLDNLLRLYIIYLIFECVYSKLYLSIPLGDIFKASRMYFLFLTPFLFSTISKDEYFSLKDILLKITVVQSLLFTIQSFTGIQILNGYFGGGLVSVGFLDFYRCYNAPFLATYFLFYALLNKEYDKKQKAFYIIIFLLPTFFSFHRSNIAAVAFSLLAVLFFYQDSVVTKLKKILLIGLFTIPVGSILLTLLSDRGGASDISSVLNGDYQEIDYVEELAGNTFSFRIAHLYERYMYITENKVKHLFGAGFVHEASFYVQQNFDFIIGLREDKTGEIIQVDTSDISWSVLVLRFGLIGAFLYFLFTFRIFLIGYRYKTTKLGGVIFGQMLVLFITSLTSTSYLFPLFYILMLSDCKILLSEKQDVQSNLKHIL